MSKAKKVWIIIAVSLILSGSGLFMIAFTKVGYDFTKLATQQYVTNTYEITEEFNAISIDVQITDVTLALSEDGKCRVECFEEDKMKHSAEVIQGMLKINVINNRKWYDNIGISFQTMKVTIYLPPNELESVLVDTNTGNVKISEKLNIKNINVLTDTGNIELTDIRCNTLKTESSTGNIALNNVIAKETFTIKNSTGNVKFKDSDAGTIYVRTSTGNVNGNLLTDKFFITETSTGNVKVPPTNGGVCEIKTSTGNINIDIPR